MSHRGGGGDRYLNKESFLKNTYPNFIHTKITIQTRTFTIYLAQILHLHVLAPDYGKTGCPVRPDPENLTKISCKPLRERRRDRMGSSKKL